MSRVCGVPLSWRQSALSGSGFAAGASEGSASAARGSRRSAANDDDDGGHGASVASGARESGGAGGSCKVALLGVGPCHLRMKFQKC